MSKLISVNSRYARAGAKGSILGRFFGWIWSLDPFLRTTVITMLLIVVATPVLVSGYILFGSNAASFDAKIYEGTIQHLHQDNFKNGKSNDYYSLHATDGNTYQVNLGNQEIRSGSKVRILGKKVNSTTIAPATSNPTQSIQIVSGSTITPVSGIKKVAVVLFKFSDTTDSLQSPSAFYNALYGPSDPSVNAYMQEASFGTVSFSTASQPIASGPVFGWYTIPTAIGSATSCDFNTWTAQANAQFSAATGYTDPIAAGYDYVIYSFPTVRSGICGWSGQGELPGVHSWINGYASVTGDVAVSDVGSNWWKVVDHEMGHNFGAHHASGYYCTGSNGNYVSLSTNCTLTEYGDVNDVMGSISGSSVMQYNAFHKAEMGWISTSAPDTLTITTSGTYKLYPEEQHALGPILLRFPRNDTYGNYYYLELRQPIGYFDTFQGSASPVDTQYKGVSTRLAPDFTIVRQTWLIDNTPGSAGGSMYDASLTPGNCLYDVAYNITICTLSIVAGSTPSSTYANVSVTFGPITIPTPTITPTAMPTPTPTTAPKGKGRKR